MIYNREMILSVIPHRYENVLVDSVSVSEGEGSRNVSHLQLAVPENDTDGRQIFFAPVSGRSQLLSPVMMEVLALGYLVGMGGISASEMLLYVAISDFEKYRDCFLGDALSGVCIDEGGKRGFVKASGTLFGPDGLPAASGKITAYVTKKSDFKIPPPSPATWSPPSNTGFASPRWASLKAPALYMCDALIFRGESDTSLTGSYRFPGNHPLIQGHFPDMPVLMGVLQWMAFEDTLRTYLAFLSDSGALPSYSNVTFNGAIKNAAGATVAEVREMGISVRVDPVSGYILTDVRRTRRIAFKAIVQPEEQIFIHLTDIDWR